jgi:hypothetical protein
MAKRGRGRPIGATSWWRNPVNYAAHHASVLIELWLAGAPVLEIRVLLSSLARRPEHQARIEECWRRRGNERRYTVPQAIKRTLCELAIAHVVQLHEETQAATPEIKEMLRRSEASAAVELRTRGWTEEQISAWFKERQTAQKRGAKDFRPPDVSKVLEIVNRRAPSRTLRRKAASRKLRK